MGYQCVADGCKNSAIFDMNVCENCFQNQTSKIVESTDSTKSFGCNNCSKVFSLKDFADHVAECGEG
jgi:hypothetical protein